MNKAEVKKLHELVEAIEDRAEAYRVLEQPEAKDALDWAAYQIMAFINSRKKVK